MIHSNVCSPFDVESIHHKQYFVSFINDFSHYAHVYFITTKDEVLSHYKDLLPSKPTLAHKGHWRNQCHPTRLSTMMLLSDSMGQS